MLHPGLHDTILIDMQEGRKSYSVAASPLQIFFLPLHCYLLRTINAVVITTIRLRYDCRSTPIRLQFYRSTAIRRPIRYDRMPTCCGLLH